MQKGGIRENPSANLFSTSLHKLIVSDLNKHGDATLRGFGNPRILHVFIAKPRTDAPGCS